MTNVTLLELVDPRAFRRLEREAARLRQAEADDAAETARQIEQHRLANRTLSERIMDLNCDWDLKEILLELIPNG